MTAPHANRAHERRPASPFGLALQECRRQRRLSQFALALRADTSARHVSFLETGRSRPTLQMVQRLADALDLPPADRNRLLGSAGFAADRSAEPLDSSALAAVRTVIAHLLRQHEPWPALLLDATYDVLDANRAARRLLCLPPLEQTPRANLVALLCGSLAPMIVNHDEVLHEIRHRLQRDLDALIAPAPRGASADATHTRLRELLTLVTLHADARSMCASPHRTDAPVLMTELRTPLGDVRTLSTLVRFGGARDITVDALHVELIYPADDVADARLRMLTADAP
jgi:transcriptional regulator with XRE-family HTH domain